MTKTRNRKWPISTMIKKHYHETDSRIPRFACWKCLLKEIQYNYITQEISTVIWYIIYSVESVLPPLTIWRGYLSRQSSVTGNTGSLIGQSLNSKYPPWLAVNPMTTSTCPPIGYTLVMMPVAYFPPSSWSRGFCWNGSPQTPHLPPYVTHWFCKGQHKTFKYIHIVRSEEFKPGITVILITIITPIHGVCKTIWPTVALDPYSLPSASIGGVL